ncbi:nef-associated protein 1 [Anopheles sinensis]|uniref:Nef-associated protein 1 n=1 Tax=Anopheles sinensis TaxID=74873 RepID=A0A084WQM8_ANOSI|nr:nef-associated protein 1 [Anopheles sinensis]
MWTKKAKPTWRSSAPFHPVRPTRRTPGSKAIAPIVRLPVSSTSSSHRRPEMDERWGMGGHFRHQPGRLAKRLGGQFPNGTFFDCG